MTDSETNVSGGSGNADGRKKANARYRVLFLEVRTILNRYDPMHIGLLENEYDPEVAAILAGLDRAATAAAVSQLVRDVFRQWFGAECPAAVEPDLVREIVEARGRHSV